MSRNLLRDYSSDSETDNPATGGGEAKELHRPVMTGRVMEVLSVEREEWYVDATLGQGGHTCAILALGGRVVAFDVDPEAIARAREFLFPGHEERLILVPSNHRDMGEILASWEIRPRGVILDSGWSMNQAGSERAGLSFEGTGPLDMRLDPTLPVTARMILEESSAEELACLLSNFGEEPLAFGIARALVQSRSRGRLPGTPRDLAAFVSGVYYRKGFRRSRRHPATRTFMALRIAVNQEIDSLVKGLEGVRPILQPGGRLAVLSFHSREDREVKHLFRNWVREKRGELLFPKPLVPSDEELSENPRSRSAKLRVFIAH